MNRNSGGATITVFPDASLFCLDTELEPDPSDVSTDGCTGDSLKEAAFLLKKDWTSPIYTK